MLQNDRVSTFVIGTRPPLVSEFGASFEREYLWGWPDQNMVWWSDNVATYLQFETLDDAYRVLSRLDPRYRGSGSVFKRWYPLVEWHLVPEYLKPVVRRVGRTPDGRPVPLTFF